MKKSLIISGAFAFALAAPMVVAEPEQIVLPAVQASASNQDEVTVAVYRFIFNSAAKGLDAVADSALESDGTTFSQAKLMVKTLANMFDAEALGELPADYQAFILESIEAAKPQLDEMLKLIDAAEAGEIDESEFTLSLLALAQKSQEAQAAVELKYPEVAAVIGQEASQRLTMKLMPELQKMAEPRIRAYFSEHPEDAMDQRKIMSASLRIVAQLFREMAAGL